MNDNESLMLKIQIRNKALKYFGGRPNLVLDMFAGECVITKMLWRGISNHVICIEKDEKKPTKVDGVDLIIGDNRDYIDLAYDADIIDCDAYGLVLGLIEKLPSKKVVVFTDGTPVKSRKVFNAEIEFHKKLKEIFSFHEVIKNPSETAYYGWGVTK